MRFEVYQNNGGAITMALKEDDNVIGILCDFEYGKRGNLLDDITEIEEDEDVFLYWDNNLLTVANENYFTEHGEEDHYTPETLLAEISGNDELIAEGEINGEKHIYAKKMGHNALDAFGLPDLNVWDIQM